MAVARRIGLFIAAAGLTAAAVAPTVSADDQRGPVVTRPDRVRERRFRHREHDRARRRALRDGRERRRGAAHQSP